MLTAHDLFGSGSGAGWWWSGTEGWRDRMKRDRECMGCIIESRPVTV